MTAFSFVTHGQNKRPKTKFENAYDFYYAGDLKKALAVYENNAEFDNSDFADGLVMKGLVFSDSMKFGEGRKYLEQAEKISDKIKEVKVIYSLYFGLGEGYYLEGDFQRSIKYFLKAEFLGATNNLIGSQRTACYYLAENYRRLNKIPTANHYIKKAIELAKVMKDSIAVVRYYATLSANYLYYSTNDTSTFGYSDTILNFLKDAALYVNKNNPKQSALLYSSYSKGYSARNDFANANMYSRKAYTASAAAGDTANIIVACSNIAQSYLEMNKLDSALFYQKKMEELKKMHPSLMSKDQRNFFYNYYRIYKGLGKKELALEYLEKWYADDARYNTEKNTDLQQLREDLENQKTNMHIEDEKEKTKALYVQKRNFNLYLSGAGFLILLISAYFVYYRFRIKKEKEKKNLQILLQNAELTALKAQMNPHFIFNALNSIQHSIVTNNSDDAYKFLSKFSKLIRNILDSSAEQVIPLKTEIETLSLYIDIESKRFDNSFACEFITLENNFDPEKIMIPPMIIQPFIENAVWHGLMPKDGTKLLKVKFEIVNEKNVEVEISDNGIGRERAAQIAAAKNKKHKSRGLINIKERISLLERTHNMKISAETKDIYSQDGKPAGTSTRITFIKTNTAE